MKLWICLNFINRIYQVWILSQQTSEWLLWWYFRILIRKVPQNSYASCHFMMVVKFAYLLQKLVSWVELTSLVFLWVLWGIFEEHIEEVEAIQTRTTWADLWVRNLHFLLVSRYSWLSFVLNICTKLALYLQFMVLFVGIVHIFMFSVILYIRYSHFVN